MNLSLMKRLRFAADIALGKDNDMLSAVQGFFGPAIGSTAPARGSSELLAMYNAAPWLRSVVNVIAENTAAVRWLVFKQVNSDGRAIRNRSIQRASFIERQEMILSLKRDGEIEEIDEHPMLNILNATSFAPNGKPLTGKTKRKLTQVYLDVNGDSFAMIERNGVDVPIGTWPLPPFWIAELPTPESPFFRIDHSWFRGNIPLTEMLWISDPDVTNPYDRGVGVARAVADEVETDEYASKMARQKFFNQGRPDFIASMPEVDEKELKRIQRAWMGEHQGFWRTMKPHFTNTDVKIHELSQNMEQLQFIPLRQYQADIVQQTFNLPPEIMGRIENSNRATIDAAHFLFGTDVLVPRLELQRESYQAFAEREYDDRIIVDYVSPVKEDKEHELAVAVAAPWTATMDEWRAFRDEEPLPDGQGEFVLMPIAGIPTPINTLNRLPEPIDDEDAFKEKDVLPDQKQADDPFYIIAHRIADRLDPKTQREFIAAVRAIRSEIVLMELAEAVTAGNVERILDLIDIGSLGERSNLQANMTAAFNETGEQAAIFTNELLGIEMTFDANDPRAIAFIRDVAGEKIKLIDDNSKAAIRQLLERSTAEGVTSDQTARLIREHIGLTEPQQATNDRLRASLIEEGLDGDELERRMSRFTRRQIKQRGETIAQNELIEAANYGQTEAWQQGIDQGLLPKDIEREFIVTPDDQLCPICEATAGQVVGLNEPFVSPYDGTTSINPHLHVKCRCSQSLSVPSV